MRRGTIVGQLGLLAATGVAVIGLGVASFIMDPGGKALAAAPAAASPANAPAGVGVTAPPSVAAALAIPWAAPAMRCAGFTWTGNSSDPDSWNEPSNWSGSGGACMYPCTSSDDATIDDCNYEIHFDASRTIDDLYLTGFDPDGCAPGTFDADGTVRTLTCDTVSFSGGQSHTLVNKAGIVTN